MPAKIASIPNAHAKAFAGIHSAAWRTHRRRANHSSKAQDRPEHQPHQEGQSHTHEALLEAISEALSAITLEDVVGEIVQDVAVIC